MAGWKCPWGKRIRVAAEWDKAELRQLLVDPDALGDSERQILKTDGTTTLWLASLCDTPCVIKRYNTRSPWHRVKRALRRTRAANCWDMAGRFLTSGIATAPPVALVEERFAGVSGKSWFVNAYVEGMLLSDLLRGRESLERCQAIAESIIELFARLHQNRLSHGDMKATNILIVDGKPLLLDLDAARQHRWNWSHQRGLQRDRRRFLKNWAQQPQIEHEFAARLSARGL